jgi:hypothetical protein
MNTKRQVPAWSLALVVMAAGVVTASSEFVAEQVGEFTPIRLPDMLKGFGDPASSHSPAARR